MRETWLIHLCTDWMGDDAWLWKLDCEFRRFNYVGDTQWLRGRVVRKYLADGDRPAVDLDLEAANQRGELTTPGHATDPAAEPRARRRCGCPIRPAARRDLQGALDAISRGVRAPMTDASRTGGRRARVDARRRRAAAHARPAREAQRDRRRDDGRPDRRRRRAPGPTTRCA